MAGVSIHETGSAAARLLAKERQLAALERGEDVFFATADAREAWGLVSGFLQYDPERFAIAIVPDLAHPIAALAGEHVAPRAIIVAPDMPEAERRDLGIALRNRAVQLLVVTAERLAQPKFIQFIRAQAPALVAAAACERLHADRCDYCPPYESLRAIRGLFPGVALLAWAETVLEPETAAALASAMGFRMPGRTDALTTPKEAAAAAPGEATPARANPAPPPATAPMTSTETLATDTTAPTESTPVAQSTQPDPIDTPAPQTTPASRPARVSHRPASIPDAIRAAFPLFERETTVAACMDACGRDAAWVYGALAIFIRQTGRTHPFPWVDKPTYLRVAMAAGQSESTDPRLIGSVLGNSVESGPLQMVLAALDNRQESGN